MVATGVNADGSARSSARGISTAEFGARWNTFFNDLVALGLPGVALLTTPRSAL